MKPAIRNLFVLLAACLFLVLIALLPLPIPPYLDFQVIYHADMGLLRGIPVYDHTGQVAMIAQLANVPPDRVNVLPFPYPPWVALIALPLAFLPITVAARLWFGFNFLMLFACVWLLTEGWEGRRRLLAFLPSIFFPPVLGTLFVGQYILPVLLGASVWVYAVQREKVILIAIASALLTFKPHLGALILLAGLVCLCLHRDGFGRRALMAILLTGIFLFAVGYLADPAWPIDYVQSLSSYRQNSEVVSCGLCASLPVSLASLLNQGSNPAAAFFIAALITVALLILWIFTRPHILRSPHELMVLSILVILLASPYLLNYDYALLLLPLLLLVGGNRSRAGWFVLTLAYVAPVIALGLLGRQGNFSLSISAAILLVMLYRETRKLDGSGRAA